MQELQDKYVLWASQKEWNYNSPVFWKKKECGYTSNLEECELYDSYEKAKDSASRNCFGDVVPVKVSSLMPYAQTQFPSCYDVLQKAKEGWDEYRKGNNDS